jgi:hypothetical protein
VKAGRTCQEILAHPEILKDAPKRSNTRDRNTVVSTLPIVQWKVRPRNYLRIHRCWFSGHVNCRWFHRMSFAVLTSPDEHKMGPRRWKDGCRVR